jgi:antirestriction protein ArdC
MAKSKTRTKSKRDIYQEVADKIMRKLDEGVVPWRKPFPGYGRSGNVIPRNYNSNRVYRGINVFLLAFEGYESPYWLTFDGAKQAAYEQAERAAGRKPKKLDKTELRKLGSSVGGVRKGEKSTMIVFWRQILIDDVDDKTGRPIKKRIPLLKYYNVFNVEQCDGIDKTRGAGEQPEADPTPFDPIREAEQIKRGYFKRDGAPSLDHVGNVACYVPALDAVRVPEAHRFEQREEYYSTTFHEMVHSTGHESRLARKGIAQVLRGSHTYADEELVAEMGAAMLCGAAGIAPAIIDNAAAYIEHWRKRISDDPKLVISAGARAQRAADYILGVTFEEDKPEASTPEADKTEEVRELQLA